MAQVSSGPKSCQDGGNRFRPLPHGGRASRFLLTCCLAYRVRLERLAAPFALVPIGFVWLFRHLIISPRPVSFVWAHPTFVPCYHLGGGIFVPSQP